MEEGQIDVPAIGVSSGYYRRCCEFSRDGLTQGGQMNRKAQDSGNSNSCGNTNSHCHHSTLFPFLLYIIDLPFSL